MTITHHYSFCFNLIFHIFVAIWPWFVCTGIAPYLISASFSANMMASMSYYSDTPLTRIIATSCLSLYSCYTIWLLITISLNNLCILIGLQLPSEKQFHLSIPQKDCCKNPHMGLILKLMVLAHPESGWPNIVGTLGLINLSTIAPFAFPQASSTVVSNYVSRLSIINASGRFLAQLSLHCSLEGKILALA